MKKYIVTTTIQPPTRATKLFAKMEDWTLVVVGDTKTPHHLYEQLDCVYLHPEQQERDYKELSDAIGWRKIQRRNIGFVYAYQNGADIVATVDDDNIPYENWGKDLHVGKKVERDFYETDNLVFDPLSVTNNSNLWHRGYPIECIPTKNDLTYLGKRSTEVMVQANLWDGDPDIDATQRLTKRPCVKFDQVEPYSTYNYTVFNSQNTFIHRDVLKHYMVFPFLGRMDDIWRAYYLQKFMDSSQIVFDKATVYQERNEQDLIRNLENELDGYRYTQDYVLGVHQLSDEVQNFITEYQKYFD